MRLVCLIACAASMHALDVGAAKRTTTPDLKAHGPVYLAGFGQNRVATAVHDDLYARCMALRAGTRPLVLCVVDAIGLFFDDVKRVRAKVPGADVVVASTHVHEGPDTMGMWGPAEGRTGINEAYNSFVVDRTAEAAQAAIAALQPAVLKAAKIQTPELDTFIDDGRPPVRHDAEIVGLVATARNGSVIGTLVNWANHPEALSSKNTEITADYLAAFHPVLEKSIGGVSVFFNGAVGGMQSPLGAKFTDAKEGTFPFAEALGRRFGEITVQALRGARPVDIQSIAFAEKLIDIPFANPAFLMAAKAGVFGGRKQPNPDNTSTTPVGYIRLSDAAQRPLVEIALIPGEMYPELSVGGTERYPGADFPDAPIETPIKQQMKAPYRMLFGLANDEIGYIIPKAEWDAKEPWLQNSPKKWYGEVNSVGPEAAPMINSAFSELIKR